MQWKKKMFRESKRVVGEKDTGAKFQAFERGEEAAKVFALSKLTIR